MGTKNGNEESIFSAAIEIDSPIERAAFVKSACGDDAALLARVENLLKVYYEDESFLKSPPSGTDITVDDTPLIEGPGTRIGRYKLLQLIGEGGFGVVYMAEQEKPIIRRVALKIIKLGMDTKQVIARFEAERQALAMMNHPNIAGVLDAGATDTGRPYFVMELVKGVPITEYCDKNNLDTHQRLELFIDVCKAVQHAHQKGIIHRDIKPSNVMITLHDGRPVPKIIDFGIAKATQHRLTEKTLFTEYRQFIGTPEYMSPEQAEISGLDVDTRSDIYSLGVLLYELLTGTTPFEAEKLRSAAYDEIRRIIREDEPPKPSTRLSTLGDALTIVAKHRNARPNELCKIVHGDLDWVVMKSLEKDRTRRYETANEFAVDIGRHLGDEPVVAGPPSVRYRLGKFVYRHRIVVISSLLIVAALLGGAVTATIGFVQAKKQQRQAILNYQLAEKQRQRAEENYRRARAAVDELTQMTQRLFEISTVTGEIGHEMLQKVRSFYQGFLEDEESSDPVVRSNIGQAYIGISAVHRLLGEYEKAQDNYHKAVDIFRDLTNEYPDKLDYWDALAAASTHYGDTLRILNRMTEAEQVLQQTKHLFEEFAAENPDKTEFRLWTAWFYHYLGDIRWDEGRLEEAKTAYGKVVEICENLLIQSPDMLGAQHQRAWSSQNLAAVLRENGQLEEAERVIEHQVMLDRQRLEESTHKPVEMLILTGSLHHFGDTKCSLGKFKESEEAFREAVNICEKLATDFPRLPPYQVIQYKAHYFGSSRNLANVLRITGKLGEAEQILRKTIDILEKRLVEFPESIDDKRELALYFHHLGDVLAAGKQYENSEKAYRRSIANNVELATRLTKDKHVEAWSYHNLADVLRNAGRIMEAEQPLRKAVELFEKLVVDNPDRVDFKKEYADMLDNLGNLLRDTGRSEESRSVYEKAKEIREELISGQQ
jgi:serine/threonine protein kinase/tetratricopeptide (TPR) repeat protein